ncbi:hypothetical protein J6G99_07830 [bacterium]|nr:hypothetical protein [Bacteroidales bacterium]MBP3821535.1 hypothetical protein [bacterium]
MEFVKGNKPIKTPKYEITQWAGDYPPMEQLKGKNGRISFYLMEKRSKKENAPEYYLQAKGSFNFTGLKDYFIDNKPSKYAYGYPLAVQTYSKERRINPFYEYRTDGFLFIFHFENNTSTPEKIELLVLKGAKTFIEWHNKALMQGGYNDILEDLRQQAKNNQVLL